MMITKIAIRIIAKTIKDKNKFAVSDRFEKKAQIDRRRTAEMQLTAGPDRNHSDAARAMIATSTDKIFCKITWPHV